jgi:hypothetical protein
MGRRLLLPLSIAPTRGAERPSVDAVRRRLGGRASTEAGAGEVVSFRDERGLPRVGVVLFVRGEDLDVWVQGDVVRRVRRPGAAPADGVVPPELLEVSGDARIFAELREGQRVRYQRAPDAGGAGEGMLVEKCRFGGLIERGDGAVLGVGFRRLWPVESA